MPSNLIQVQISISFWQSQQTESTKKLVFLKAIYFDAFVLDSLNYVSFFFFTLMKFVALRLLEDYIESIEGMKKHLARRTQPSNLLFFGELHGSAK